MEMARSILKHMNMPNYFWGEAIHHSTYLLNRMATRALKEMKPYKLYRNKRPNMAHLRVFGCVGYARIEGTRLKKLDDRSLMLVHLGNEPVSKAYCLYDPRTRRIKVSRGNIFDETKGWDLTKESSEKHDDGSFVITFGTYGNHGLVEHTSNDPSISNQVNNNNNDTLRYAMVTL